jgi:hypothetical protein
VRPDGGKDRSVMGTYPGPEARRCIFHQSLAHTCRPPRLARAAVQDQGRASLAGPPGPPPPLQVMPYNPTPSWVWAGLAQVVSFLESYGWGGASPSSVPQPLFKAGRERCSMYGLISSIGNGQACGHGDNTQDPHLLLCPRHGLAAGCCGGHQGWLRVRCCSRSGRGSHWRVRTNSSASSSHQEWTWWAQG